MVKKKAKCDLSSDAVAVVSTGCIVPNGCLEGVPICDPLPDDAVKVLCSKTNCTETLYLHSKCYDKWESDLMHIARRSGGTTGNRSREWSLRDLQTGLWKTGFAGGSYKFVISACPCPCGGHLTKDLEYEFAKSQSEELEAPKVGPTPKPRKPAIVYPRFNLTKSLPGQIASHLARQTTFGPKSGTRSEKTISVVRKNDQKVPEAKHFWDELSSENKVTVSDVKKKKTHNKQRKSISEREAIDPDTQSAGNGDRSKGSVPDNWEQISVPEDAVESRESEADRVKALYNRYDLSVHIELCYITGKEYKRDGDLLETLVDQL